VPGPKDILISDYTYELPTERIAQHPLDIRDESRLLVYSKGIISETIFSGISNVLPKDSLLIFNDTRVIKARLLFPTASGKIVEIFCLEPAIAGTDLHTALFVTGNTKWECFIGNLKSLKSGKLSFQFDGGVLDAEISERISESFNVDFKWQPAEFTFAEILEIAGKVPLPPYMKRPPKADDSIRYQTIYANENGSVAAPTAGLHFTERVLKGLVQKGIKSANVTLHVGAGTFKPVKSETIAGHEMHSEIFSVSREVIKLILEQDLKNIIAVGTTSLRTIESVYWYGVQLLKGRSPADDIFVHQWEPYDDPSFIPAEVSLNAVLSEMSRKNADSINGRTGIIIVPGYEFRVFKGLITNFHQPQSTLLLLIAAFIGSEWKKVYDYALNNDFRFLSYGDSSLLFR
jgi:S-adenosylmethionine:tRNA ribosyltransferase-isomerase